MVVPATRASSVPITIDVSNCSWVRMKMDRARRSASTDCRMRSRTRTCSWGSAAAVRTAIRLVTVSATTPVASEWWCSNSWEAARTSRSRRQRT